MSFDRYVYPGTNILINKQGIMDARLLYDFERNFSLKRSSVLRSMGVTGTFDAKHLQDIHAFLFCDVYSREDNALNMLYDFLFHKHDGFKNTVRLYFENNPGSDYVIENFEPRVLSDGILFFAKDYFSGIVGHMIPGIMCRFDEIQFERMLVVRDALDAYSIRVDECLKHAFDTCDFDGLCLLDL